MLCTPPHPPIPPTTFFLQTWLRCPCDTIVWFILRTCQVTLISLFSQDLTAISDFHGTVPTDAKEAASGNHWIDTQPIRKTKRVMQAQQQADKSQQKTWMTCQFSLVRSLLIQGVICSYFTIVSLGCFCINHCMILPSRDWFGTFCTGRNRCEWEGFQTHFTRYFQSEWVWVMKLAANLIRIRFSHQSN